MTAKAIAAAVYTAVGALLGVAAVSAHGPAAVGLGIIAAWLLLASATVGASSVGRPMTPAATAPGQPKENR